MIYRISDLPKKRPMKNVAVFASTHVFFNIHSRLRYVTKKCFQNPLNIIFLRNQTKYNSCFSATINDPSLENLKNETFIIDKLDFQISCKASAPIKKCIFQFEKSAIEVPEGFKGDFQYIGTGFENGDCGIEIEGSWDMQGNVSCIVQLKDYDQNLTSSGTIIVDDASGTAILESNSASHILQFNESQPISFSCRAQAGKYSKAELLLGNYLKHFLCI